MCDYPTMPRGAAEWLRTTMPRGAAEWLRTTMPRGAAEWLRTTMPRGAADGSHHTPCAVLLRFASRLRMARPELASPPDAGLLRHCGPIGRALKARPIPSCDFDADLSKTGARCKGCDPFCCAPVHYVLATCIWLFVRSNFCPSYTNIFCSIYSLISCNSSSLRW